MNGVDCALACLPAINVVSDGAIRVRDEITVYRLKLMLVERSVLTGKDTSSSQRQIKHVFLTGRFLL